MIPRIKAFFGTLVRLLLATFLLNGCQPSTLYVGVESEPTTTASRTPQAKPSAAALKIHKLSSVVLTSSSDSSPDTAAPDRDTSAQSIANAPQGNILAFASADTSMTEASREVARKRPADSGLQDRQLPAAKYAKKQESMWSRDFMQAIDKLEENEDVYEESWRKIQEICRQDGALTQIFQASDNKSHTLLSYAAAKGQLAVVKHLVEQRAELGNQEGVQALLHAASRGHLDVVRYLVKEKNVDSQGTDEDGASALHYAAAGQQGENNKMVIQYLISTMGDKTAQKIMLEAEDPVLSAAVFACNIPVVDYWVQYTKKILSLDSINDTQKKEKVKNIVSKAMALAQYKQTAEDPHPVNIGAYKYIYQTLREAKIE